MLSGTNHTHPSTLSFRQLHSERPSLPEVPAIYFISPTFENLSRIAKDLKENLYLTTYLNFTSTLPKKMLEFFGELVARDGTVERVEQVFDQHLDFLCLSKSLFSLTPSLSTPPNPSSPSSSTSNSSIANSSTPKNTYTLLNSPSTSEQTIETLTDQISKGLFSVLVTMSTGPNGGGGVPIIRAPRGNAAEMVARKLDRLIRDHLASSGTRGLNAFSSNSSSGGSSGKDGFSARPRESIRTSLSHSHSTSEADWSLFFTRIVLVLFDRNVDLVPMLSHSWTYQALVNDVLGMKLNRVTVEVKNKKKRFLSLLPFYSLPVIGYGGTHPIFVINNRHRILVKCLKKLTTWIRKISSGLKTLKTLSLKLQKRSISS